MTKNAIMLVTLGFLAFSVRAAYGQQYQDCIDVKVDKVYVKSTGSGNSPAAIVTVTNNCKTFLKGIGINCVWLKGNRAIATEKTGFQNMPSGATDSHDFWADETNDSFDSIRCRVDTAY